MMPLAAGAAVAEAARRRRHRGSGGGAGRRAGSPPPASAGSAGAAGRSGDGRRCGAAAGGRGGSGLGGRRGGGLALALLLGLALALLLASLRLERHAHLLVLQPLRLDLLQPTTSASAASWQARNSSCGVLERGLVVGDLPLVGLERRAGLVEVVHGVGRRLGDDVDEDVGLQLVARLAGSP